MYKELDVVVLRSDQPDLGLRRGDIGTVVGVYSDSAYEVEFVDAGGQTVGVLTLEGTDIRPMARREMLNVRDLDAAITG